MCIIKYYSKYSKYRKKTKYETEIFNTLVNILFQQYCAYTTEIKNIYATFKKHFSKYTGTSYLYYVPRCV